MTQDKFKTEIETLDKFFTLYCHNKHKNTNTQTLNITYNESKYILKLNLCQKCLDSLNYSIKKLQACPYEIKPRCRKCPNICYEKNQWKEVAKVMKYSSIKLGLGKIKSKLFGFTK